jgi:hypothetical protein
VSIDILDSEVLECEKVLEVLKDRAIRHGALNLGHFDNEIKTRFAEIGFAVDVKWWHTNVEGVKMPEIEIIGRTAKKDFDHDQMRHEVTADILGLGQGGTIKVNPEDVLAAKQYEQSHKKAHGGGACDGDHQH